MTIVPKPECPVGGCDRQARGGNLCITHQRYAHAGRPLVPLRGRNLGKAGDSTPCSVADCSRLSSCNGMCTKHNARAANGGDVSVKSMFEKTAEQRFFEKVNKRGGVPTNPYRWNPSMGECWLWTAAKRGSDMRDPYGAFRDGGKQNTAHKWSYQFHVGPVPAGMTIDHLCCVKLCVRPGHLEVVTTQENTLRRDISRQRPYTLSEVA